MSTAGLLPLLIPTRRGNSATAAGPADAGRFFREGPDAFTVRYAFQLAAPNSTAVDYPPNQNMEPCSNNRHNRGTPSQFHRQRVRTPAIYHGNSLVAGSTCRLLQRNWEELIGIDYGLIRLTPSRAPTIVQEFSYTPVTQASHKVSFTVLPGGDSLRPNDSLARQVSLYLRHIHPAALCTPQPLRA